MHSTAADGPGKFAQASSQQTPGPGEGHPKDRRCYANGVGPFLQAIEQQEQDGQVNERLQEVESEEKALEVAHQERQHQHPSG